MIIFEGFISLIEHFRGNCAIEVGHGSLEIAIVHLDVEGGRQILSGFGVDIKKLLSFSSQSVTHVSDIVQSFQVIAGQTHISSHFPIIHTFCQNISGVSQNELIEFNTNEMVSA